MRVLSATAAFITTERLAGQIQICDGNTGQRIGTAEIVRGFAHYYGARGSAHQGMKAVVTGGLEGLTRALAQGLRNGRDDRN